jgi:uncharacterized protein YqeY
MGWLISEVEMVGKNKGNRLTTDDEAISVMKKLITNMRVTLEANENEFARVEIAIVESYIPVAISADTVNAFIDGFINDNPESKMGIVVAAVKKEFGQAVDMRVASTHIKQKLGM